MDWAGLAVALLGLALAAAGLFRAFWPIAPGPEYRQLDSRARGVLEKRVRQEAGEPADDEGEAESDEDLTLLRTTAEIMVLQRNLIAVLLGCLLIQVGTTVAAPTLVHVLVSVLFAVPLAALAGFLDRRARAGLAFQQRHRTEDRTPDAPANPAPTAETEAETDAGAEAKADAEAEAKPELAPAEPGDG